MNQEQKRSPRRPHARLRWVGAIVVGAIVVGVGLAAWQWESSRRPKPAPQAPVDPVSDAVIRHALEAAGAEGQRAEKTRWVDEVPGVDLALLPAARREIFLRFANAERCTCDCGYTLGGCRNYDADCDVSLPRVRALFDSVRRGLVGSPMALRARPARVR